MTKILEDLANSWLALGDEADREDDAGTAFHRCEVDLRDALKRLPGLGTVALLMTKDGHVVSVNATEALALEKMRAFNADPFLEDGSPDVCAPYMVQVWNVQEAPR